MDEAAGIQGKWRELGTHVGAQSVPQDVGTPEHAAPGQHRSFTTMEMAWNWPASQAVWPRTPESPQASAATTASVERAIAKGLYEGVVGGASSRERAGRAKHGRHEAQLRRVSVGSPGASDVYVRL